MTVQVDSNLGYLEAATEIQLIVPSKVEGVPPRTIVVEVDDDLKNCIEDYLNAPNSHGRPFVDYRPDIGSHLFPSHVTGLGIGRWRLRRLLGKLTDAGFINNAAQHSPLAVGM